MVPFIGCDNISNHNIEDVNNSWYQSVQGDDEPYGDWLGNNELKNRIITSYEDKKKKISFSFKKFHSIEKENIESSFEINFEKENSFLQFIKYYHDWSGKIFFSSEISGKCKKKNS